jgi:thioredoxin-like negative regulator of GroEL
MQKHNKEEEASSESKDERPLKRVRVSPTTAAAKGSTKGQEVIQIAIFQTKVARRPRSWPILVIFWTEASSPSVYK